VKIDFKKLIFYILGTVLVGSLPAILLGDQFNYYGFINKPPFSPPGTIFPIVWTVLYILMGISLYLVNTNTNDTKPTTIYVAQLIVNALWSVFFFGLELTWFSAFWIVLLIGLVIWMIVEFFKVNKVAAYLQIPYLLWLFFALYLNVGVAILN